MNDRRSPHWMAEPGPPSLPAKVLILREEQRQAFVEARFDELRTWLLPHVRAHFAPQVGAMDDRALAALIERAVARARKLGATRSDSISRFVHLWIVFGDGLEALPWAAEALGGDEPLYSGGDVRIDRLARRARGALVARGAAP